MRRGDTGYPVAREYVAALDSFARTRWGWDGVRRERAALVADVMTGATELLRLLTDPGDAVVVACPVYPPFYGFVEHAGRTVVEAPLGDDARLDPAALDRAFGQARRDGRRAAFLLCNPHNPTGTVHTAAELATVAELAGRHGVRVIADEIHAPLALPGASFTPYLSVPGSEDGFALLSASKGWNLAGLKAAVAVAGPAAVRELEEIPEIVSHGPSHLGVLAHTAALREGGEWLDALLASLDSRRELLASLVEKRLPDVRFRPPQGTFLAWLDFRGVPGLPAEDPAARGDVRSLTGPAGVLLERARVALSAGAAFGTGGQGHARLNFATSPEVLTEAVERIAAALEAS